MSPQSSNRTPNSLDEIKKHGRISNEFFHAFTGNVSDVIRTHDLPLRRRTLYPAELQRQAFTAFDMHGFPRHENPHSY